MELFLWIIASMLVISGIAGLVSEHYSLGVTLIVIGLLVGPMGVSVFT